MRTATLLAVGGDGRHLDAMVAQLRRAGIDVEVVPEVYPNGRFAALADPEGNPVQLWEPSSA